LLCLTARILHVTPYHCKKHNGDDARQKSWHGFEYTFTIKISLLCLQLFMNSHWCIHMLLNWTIPNIDLTAQNQFLSSCGIHICPWCVLSWPEWLLCMFIWPFWNSTIHSMKCCNVFVPWLCICCHLAVNMDEEAYLCPWKQMCGVNFFAGPCFQFQYHYISSYPLHIKEWTLVSSVACYVYYKSASPALFQSKICG